MLADEHVLIGITLLNFPGAYNTFSTLFNNFDTPACITQSGTGFLFVVKPRLRITGVRLSYGGPAEYQHSRKPWTLAARLC